MIDCYVAGKTFEHKDTIKAINTKAGSRVFSWDQTRKVWRCRDCPLDAFDKLSEIVERKCPGCFLKETEQTTPTSEPPKNQEWPPKEEEIPF